MYDAILFDLDGTLLPMDLDEFIRGYFQLLAKKAAPYGYAAEPLIRAVWQGTASMIKNDGAVSNETRFWDCFATAFGEEARKMAPVFDAFYENEFRAAARFTSPAPEQARRVVELARKCAKKVILATNPIFPRVGVETRLGWLGLRTEDFDFVTTYENASFCKPNPDYYRQILHTQALAPARCLMIGNDMQEDYSAARAAGIETYLVTDCLLHQDALPLPPLHGTFTQLLDFLSK